MRTVSIRCPEREIERLHLIADRRNTYVACADMDFIWSLKDVHEIERMWKVGFPLHIIAQSFQRDFDETGFLIADRSRKGKIGNRPGGAFGMGM